MSGIKTKIPKKFVKGYKSKPGGSSRPRPSGSKSSGSKSGGGSRNRPKGKGGKPQPPPKNAPASKTKKDDLVYDLEQQFILRMPPVSCI